MPVLPLIDLLILLATGSIAMGFLLKAVELTTVYRFYPLGFSATDFALLAMLLFAFALTLAARTWVKVNEPALLAVRRRVAADVARRRARDLDLEPVEDGVGREAATVTSLSDATRERN